MLIKIILILISLKLSIIIDHYDGLIMEKSLTLARFGLFSVLPILKHNQAWASTIKHDQLRNDGIFVVKMSDCSNTDILYFSSPGCQSINQMINQPINQLSN